MGNPLARFLDSQRFVTLDGGLATELERRGADLRDPLWSAKLLLDAPEMIEELHYDYFVAGADVGTGASYQASFQGFLARGIDAARAEHLLRLSVALVRRARQRFWSDERNRAGRIEPLVAASVGCYGAMLHDGSEYRGDYGLSRAELRTFHERRLRVLEDSGADIIACETIPSRLEAEALVSLLEAPAWISFSCRKRLKTARRSVVFSGRLLPSQFFIARPTASSGSVAKPRSSSLPSRETPTNRRSMRGREAGGECSWRRAERV